ncbi:MAG TPA: type 4a pilus biogenesis protein PilO [Burkholderiales bacterium]|nr:type 4a pilus biogenesis protein PilO [Burkholderiales bacterium]
MTWLRWWVSSAASRFGWRGMSGMAMMLAALLFGAFVLLPMESREDEIKARLSAPAAQPGRQASARRASGTAAGLDAFYRSLPGDDALTDLLAKLHDVGERNGLALQQAEYRAAEERNPYIGRYRISIPATATYPHLKQFLAALLADIPNLSLDQLSLQRRTSGDATVEVQMQFTLYLRQRT